MTNEYPELTPYQFAGNSPITFIDRDGAESTYRMPDGSLYIQVHSDHLRLPIPQYVQQNGEFISAGKGDLTGISTTLDFIPFVGSVKGLVEGIAGEDLAGNKLSARERIMGVVPYLGKVKKLTKVVKAADKINDVKTAQKAASKVDDVANASKKLVDDANDATKNRVKLRRLRKKLRRISRRMRRVNI